MENRTFIELIISQIKALVNEFAFNKMTDYTYLDPEKVLESMKKYGDENLGSYATRTFFNL